MYINISRYAGAAGKIGEAAPKVQQGFVPMLKGQPGFHGYAAFASEQGDIVAVTIWEDADALTNSRDKIRAWVTGNLTGFDEPTERFHGEVGQHALAAPQSGGQGQSLYCLIRKAENLLQPKRCSARSAMRCWPPPRRPPVFAASTTSAPATIRPSGPPSCSATPANMPLPCTR